MNLSIIIVSWNVRDLLRQCLHSIDAPTAEIIVVDNASTDKSVEMVRREFPDVVVIANPEYRGFAAGNNQAFRVSKGRYLLYLNVDTVVLQGSLLERFPLLICEAYAAQLGRLTRCGRLSALAPSGAAVGVWLITH